MDIPKLVEIKVDRDENGGDGDTHIYVMGKDILGWMFGILTLGLVIAFTTTLAFPEYGWLGVRWVIIGWCFVGLICYWLTRYLISRGKK